MPNLPIMAVNNAPVYARLVAAFNSDPEEYRTWLRRALVLEVLERERAAIKESAREEARTRSEELVALVLTEWPDAMSVTPEPTTPTPEP